MVKEQFCPPVRTSQLLQNTVVLPLLSQAGTLKKGTVLRSTP